MEILLAVLSWYVTIMVVVTILFVPLRTLLEKKKPKLKKPLKIAHSAIGGSTMLALMILIVLMLT